MFQVDVAGRWYGAPYLGRQGGGLGAQEQPRLYRAMALLMAWMPLLTALQSANVMNVEGITEGENIHVGCCHHRH
jgi:hypothetical protein